MFYPVIAVKDFVEIEITAHELRRFVIEVVGDGGYKGFVRAFVLFVAKSDVLEPRGRVRVADVEAHPVVHVVYGKQKTAVRRKGLRREREKEQDKQGDNQFIHIHSLHLNWLSGMPIERI